jgi:hypothetical protein
VLEAPVRTRGPINRRYGLPAELDERRARPVRDLLVRPGLAVGPEPRAPQTLDAALSLQRLSLPLVGPV